MKSPKLKAIEEQMQLARKNKDWRLSAKLFKQHMKQSFHDDQVKYDERADVRKAKIQKINEKTAPIQNKAKEIKGKLDYAIDSHVPCPRCKSKNTSLLQNDTKSMRVGNKIAAGLIFLPLALFVGRRKYNHGECFDCGKKWAIN